LGFYRADWQLHDDRISPAYFDVVVNWEEVSGILYPGSLKSYLNVHPNVSPHYDLLYDMPDADKITSFSSGGEFESKVMTITFNDADVAKSIYEIRLEFGTNSPPEMVSLRTSSYASKFRHTSAVQYLYPPTTSFKSIQADQFTGIKTHMIDDIGEITKRIASLENIFNFQYVQIEETVDTYLSFAEVKIYTGNYDEVQVDSITTNFDEWDAYPIANVIDGDTATIFHEGGNTPLAYIKFKINTNLPITKIVIYNRPESGIWDRMTGHVISIIDGFGDIKFSSSISTSAASYTFLPSY